MAQATPTFGPYKATHDGWELKLPILFAKNGRDITLRDVLAQPGKLSCHVDSEEYPRTSIEVKGTSLKVAWTKHIQNPVHAKRMDILFDGVKFQSKEVNVDLLKGDKLICHYSITN